MNLAHITRNDMCEIHLVAINNSCYTYPKCVNTYWVNPTHVIINNIGKIHLATIIFGINTIRIYVATIINSCDIWRVHIKNTCELNPITTFTYQIQIRYRYRGLPDAHGLLLVHDLNLLLNN